MNPNESELEEQLRQLRPRAAGREMEQNVAAALNRAELAVVQHAPAAAVLPRRKGGAVGFPLGLLQGFGWALGGAAVAIVAIIPLSRIEESRKSAATPAEATAASPEQYEHTESTEQLVAAQDEGIILAGNSEPVRQVRYQTLERHVWVDARTGARMEFEVPREDVRFTPASFQ